MPVERAVLNVKCADRQSLGRKRRHVPAVPFLLALVAALAFKGGQAMALKIESPAFSHNGAIPAKYTCDGDDISPPLRWSDVPQGAKSLVLIVDDPDAPDPAAPRMTWVHWVLYNLPPDATALPEGVSRQQLPPGTKEGLNDWKRTGYGGPCPPIGRHRYFFKLYALDTTLPDLGPATKAQVEQAIKGHVLEHAELVGTYQKARR
ncbi:MAG: YbhB/YbcL family Raf kinase inhibitor-like protein [Candidatus Binatia bacterium]|nr:YbhB/YbcL family Raf kinase inhibitor-like protein [Candidatus Binatia bacterium]